MNAIEEKDTGGGTVTLQLLHPPPCIPVTEVEGSIVMPWVEAVHKIDAPVVIIFNEDLNRACAIMIRGMCGLVGFLAGLAVLLIFSNNYFASLFEAAPPLHLALGLGVIFLLGVIYRIVRRRRDAAIEIKIKKA